MKNRDMKKLLVVIMTLSAKISSIFYILFNKSFDVITYFYEFVEKIQNPTDYRLKLES